MAPHRMATHYMATHCVAEVGTPGVPVAGFRLAKTRTADIRMDEVRVAKAGLAKDRMAKAGDFQVGNVETGDGHRSAFHLRRLGRGVASNAGDTSVASAQSASLDRTEKKIKAAWPDELRKFYRQVGARVAEDGADPIHHAVAAVKKADDAAYDARMDAEATFDEAERRMSASMAREGAQKAIDAYGLHEQAIRKAEAVARHKIQP